MDKESTSARVPPESRDADAGRSDVPMTGVTPAGGGASSTVSNRIFGKGGFVVAASVLAVLLVLLVAPWKRPCDCAAARSILTIEGASIARSAPEMPQDATLTSAATSAPEIRIRLTLLNRGDRDALVRPQAEIRYRGKLYPMMRMVQHDGDLAAGPIGKVEQVSMVQFWYAFRTAGLDASDASAEVCRSGEQVEVVLFNQDRRGLRRTLTCDGEGHAG